MVEPDDRGPAMHEDVRGHPHRRWVPTQPRTRRLGAVLRLRQHVREMCGGEPGQASNNRMERGMHEAIALSVAEC